MNSTQSSHRSTALDTLGDDVKGIGKDVAKSAREHITEPVAAMVQDAQHALHQGAMRAQDAITEKFDSTCKALADNVEYTQKVITRERDRASSWISANPFAAIGMAVVAGALLVGIGRRHHG